MKAVPVKGTPILLVRKDADVFAVFNRCPNLGCTFEKRILNDYIVICPCHGLKFDTRNGQYIENKQTALQTYRCKIEDGDILVEADKPK
jgi:nitrite reductase/ring-hydroxylating ferredoxin subunit